MSGEKQVEAVGNLIVDYHPDTLVANAFSSGARLDLIEKLMELKEKHDKAEAKKAFFKAMASFNKEIIIVKDDKKNTQYNSSYSSKGNLVNTVSPFLGKNGLFHTFDIHQNDGSIEVTCTITHEMGHSISVEMSSPPDKSGNKNAIQQIKSTKTYLEIATFESVTGVASSISSDDEDGNSYGKKTKKRDMQGWKDFIDDLAESGKGVNNLSYQYGKNEDQIKYDLSADEVKVLINYVSQNKKMLIDNEKPKMVSCPENGLEMVETDCNDQECKKTCKNFKGE